MQDELALIVSHLGMPARNKVVCQHKLISKCAADRGDCLGDAVDLIVYY